MMMLMIAQLYGFKYSYLQDANVKYGIILQTFFLVWFVQFLKKHYKSKFSWLALLLFKHF